MNVPLLDLKTQYTSLREEILREVTRVLDSQRYVLGPEVEALEQELAAYSQSQFAVGCANGSDALFLALLALDIGPGDKVLTTPFTFFATAGAISRSGATPIFADIDPATYNIDPAAALNAIRKHKVKAILPVHLYGGAADLDLLIETGTSSSRTPHKPSAPNTRVAEPAPSAKSAASAFTPPRTWAEQAMAACSPPTTHPCTQN